MRKIFGMECTGGQEHCAFKHPAIIQTDRNQRWNHKEYVNYTSFLTPVCSKYKFKGEKIDNIKGKYLFIYTDGLDEAENLKQELFGKERLLEVLRGKIADKASQAIETMTAEVEKHRNGAEPNDDLTMMCINIKNHNEYDYQD